MKYVLGGGAVVLFCLAAATTSDAGGKKKKDAGSDLPPRADEIPKYMKMLTAGNSKERVLAIHKIGLRGTINAANVDDAVEPIKTALEKDGDADIRKEAARASAIFCPTRRRRCRC